MYSVVLMMAMTTGAEAPDCHRSCHACSGGCYVSSCHARHERHHRGHGCHSACYSSCYGGACYGGGCYGCGGVIVTPAPEKVGPPQKTEGPAASTILVNLPADARLSVDGAKTTSTSSTRTLVTPDLEPGYDYVYTLQANVVRDGQTVTQSQRVTVRAGEQTRVSFDFATTGVASSR